MHKHQCFAQHWARGWVGKKKEVEKATFPTLLAMIVAVVRAKGSRVLEAHPHPKIPKVTPPREIIYA